MEKKPSRKYTSKSLRFSKDEVNGADDTAFEIYLD